MRANIELGVVRAVETGPRNEIYLGAGYLAMRDRRVAPQYVGQTTRTREQSGAEVLVGYTK